MPSPLLDLVQPARMSAVVDIGANPVDGDPPYKAMLREGLCTVTGFEPQPDALAELQRRKGPHETYLPDAVGDGRTHLLRITRGSGMTSLLRPDPHRLAQFNGFSDWGAVEREVEVETRRLDDIDGLAPTDLLKIDVQGGELMVFQGAPLLLSTVVAVQTEISFVPLYEAQPTFGDIDAELRRHGLVPHCFTAVKNWAIAPVVFDGDFRRGQNQLLEADLVYVRDFALPDLMSDEQLQHLAMVAHHVYGSVDLTYRCVQVLGQRGLADVGAPNEYLRLVYGG